VGLAAWRESPLAKEAGLTEAVRKGYFCRMIEEIRNRMATVPFEPFAVITSGGSRYTVPTVDHLALHPKGTRVVIFFDDDSSVTVGALHITAVETEKPVV